MAARAFRLAAVLAVQLHVTAAAVAADGGCPDGAAGDVARGGCRAALPADNVDQLIDTIAPMFKRGETDRAEKLLENVLEMGKVAEILLDRLRDRHVPFTADDLVALRSSEPPAVQARTEEVGAPAAGPPPAERMEREPVTPSPPAVPRPATAPSASEPSRVGLLSASGGPAPGERVPPPETAAQAALLARSQALLSNGDVAGARLLLERLVRDGPVARAALLLGETFDPLLLARRRLRTPPDRDQALALYRKAAAAGSQEATARLQDLVGAAR